MRTPAGIAYDGIKRLGTLSLPFLIEEINKGDETLIPLVRDWTGNEPNINELKDTAEDARKKILIWWGNRKEYWTIPSLNK